MSYCQDCAAKDDEIERLRDALEHIQSWCRAYPVKVFPEPDWKQVRAALERDGITLDQVSGSNMRHVVEKMDEYVTKALEERR